jgi:hypothetical protein
LHPRHAEGAQAIGRLLDTGVGLAVDVGGNRGGVAGSPLVAGSPPSLAGELVETDDAGAATGADVDDQEIAFNER